MFSAMLVLNVVLVLCIGEKMKKEISEKREAREERGERKEKKVLLCLALY
jgi:hypothetical protein